MSEFVPRPNAATPMGMTPGYKRALDRAEGQCEFRSKPLRMNDKPRRCERYINGGYRLYLTTGDELLCEQHFNRARLEAKKRGER